MVALWEMKVILGKEDPRGRKQSWEAPQPPSQGLICAPAEREASR